MCSRYIQVLIFLIPSTLAAVSGPTQCQLTIVRCCDSELNTALPLRCFEVNKCPGLYWHGKRTCSKSIVASAISALNRKSPRKSRIQIKSNGSNKVKVEFGVRSNEIEANEEKEEKFPTMKQPRQLPHPSLIETAYLPINKRVQPVFWSNQNYLTISEIGMIG
eukprot:GFUD01003988.1.p1 GENE.GFUD01003988.1~~GFUD01003988.1.p1  ORF type:complete len:163 (+),score=28.21 GFUD01003988.1:70-558(+)